MGAIRRLKGWEWALAAAALAAIAISLLQLLGDERWVEREGIAIGDTPATIYWPAEGPADGPVVLVSHGFAGARPLMDPFALTLAANGYTAVSFDYLGHGRNPEPLHGDITAQEGAAQALVDQTRAVAEYVQGREDLGEVTAVLGHSMASNIIVRYAQEVGDIEATVGVSMFAPTVDAESPANLISIVGGLERRLKEEGQRVVAMVADEEPEDIVPGRTYGDHEAGTARRLAVAPGVEHVGVLYSSTSLEEAIAWLDAALERESEGHIASRGPWIVLLLVAVIALARPLSRLLGRVPPSGPSPGADWRRLGLVAGVPALLTPLILAPVPTDFLPVLIADYVAAHFAVYGLLSGAMLWWVAGRPGVTAMVQAARPQAGSARLLLAVAALLVYSVLVLGAVLDAFVTVFYPIPERLPIILAILAGTLPFFLTDEWLTRGERSVRGAYPLTKLTFLLSLGIAVALDPDGLFFLLLIVPVVVVFFVIYGIFSRWSYRGTGNPLVAGLANAMAFAWALGVTFPMLGPDAMG